MPTFNRDRYLRLAIDSVLSQTFTDWELILADDGSDAPTLSFLRAIAATKRIKLLELEHSGNPARARNAAIRAANAPVVAFLDSDDLWEPAKLERQLAALERDSECRWSYTAFTIIDELGIPLPSESNRRWVPHSGEVFVQTVRTTISIRVSAVMVETVSLLSAGSFDAAMDYCEDYDLWMRLALHSPIAIVDEPLTRIRRHPENQQKRPGRAYELRDYSLTKLVKSHPHADSRLLARERRRNAMLRIAQLTRLGHKSQALDALCQSFSYGWQHLDWWLGAAKELTRLCVGTPGDRGEMS